MVHDASFPTATNLILEKRRAGYTKVTKEKALWKQVIYQIDGFFTKHTVIFHTMSFFK